MAANDWVRANPEEAAQKIQEWTKIDKEVAYIFLGPEGIDTLDPTIKPRWIAALKTDYGVLKSLNMVKDLDIDKWVNDSFVRAAFKESGRDYDAQLASFSNYRIKGEDTICNAPIDDPSRAGQIWLDGGKTLSFSSAACTLEGVNRYRAEGKKLDAVYLMDQKLGIKLFANDAFFTVADAPGKRADIEPFLLKRDADESAQASGAKVVNYAQALSAVGNGGK
jgi:NitT/TauT family transport system substrate-binding protein